MKTNYIDTVLSAVYGNNLQPDKAKEAIKHHFFGFNTWINDMGYKLYFGEIRFRRGLWFHPVGVGLNSEEIQYYTDEELYKKYLKVVS